MIRNASRHKITMQLESREYQDLEIQITPIAENCIECNMEFGKNW